MNDKVKVKLEPTGNDSVIGMSSPKKTYSDQHKRKHPSDNFITSQDRNAPIGISTPKSQKVNKKQKNGVKKSRNHTNSTTTGSVSTTTTNSSSKLSSFFVNLPNESTATSNSISNVFMTSKSSKPVQKVQFKGEPIDQDEGGNENDELAGLAKNPVNEGYTPCNDTKHFKTKTSTKTKDSTLDNNSKTKHQDISQSNISDSLLTFSKSSKKIVSKLDDDCQVETNEKQQQKRFTLPKKYQVDKSDVYVKTETETEEDYLNLLELGLNNPFELSEQEQIFLNYSKLDIDKWIQECSDFNKEYQKLFEEVIKIRLKFNKRFLLLIGNLNDFVINLEKHGEKLNNKSGLIKEYCEKIVNGIK